MASPGGWKKKTRSCVEYAYEKRNQHGDRVYLALREGERERERERERESPAERSMNPH